MPSMPQTRPDRRDAEEVIVGVDTHKDVHVVAVISVLGVLLGSRSFPATAAGYQALVGWSRSFGTLHRAGVECTGSYGAALARHLLAVGLEVIEVNQPDNAHRRRHGKTDAIDAEAAARAVLSGRATAHAKAGNGPAAMLRVFKLAKASAIKSRTQAINQLKAVLVAADSDLREALASFSNSKLIRHCANLEAITPTDAVTAAHYTLRQLARRIRHLTEEIDGLDTCITETINDAKPQLLQRFGVGPDSAASLLIAAGDNTDRLATEASFAALCGVTPVEASSGKTHRRRLNRGGNRQANAALYRITLSRLRWDERTRTYLARRIAEGRTRREVIRCLKRYIARELYQLIADTPRNEPTYAT